MLNHKTRSRNVTGLMLAGVMAALPVLSVVAQILPDPPPQRLQTNLPIQTTLLEAENLARQGVPIDQMQQELGWSGTTMRDNGDIHVEIVGPEGQPAITNFTLNRVGGRVTNTWLNRSDAEVPVNRLSALARMLPDGYFLERAEPLGYDAVGGEGATTMNSSSYRNGGANGAGKTIAVIDGGYRNLTAARNAGDAPPNSRTTQINYTGSSFESGSRHGTGCVEAAYDSCPGATWRLYRIDSITDMGTAVTNSIANGVDVITHSLSRYNLGWNNNAGAACAAANNAAANNILFFTSAGNRAQQHWQGNFSSTGGSSFHNFSGGDETINITINNGGGGSFYLAWDTAGGPYNYDLLLYDQNINLVASSTNGGNTYEAFGYTNNGASQTFHIAVRRISGGTTEFEIFFHSGGGAGNFQYQTASSSTTSPSNAGDPEVISVGAVDWNNHSSTNGTSGINMSYSSQGPSNGGFRLPDIAGPTNTGSTAYGGSFGGTSCATPNSAGAACAFWSSVPGYSSNAIRYLMFNQADRWKDWGANGDDNIYGAGGVILYDYRANRSWLARGFGNTTNLTTGPAYTFIGAYNNAVNGGRIFIYPGGSYPETFVTTTKSISEVEIPGLFMGVNPTSALLGD